MESEEFIIKSVLDGRINDFEKIVQKYQSIVFAICMNIIKDPLEAENLAQETFIQAYKSLEGYKFKGFKTWITRIATNKAIDYKRKMKLSNSSNVIYIDELADEIPENNLSLQETLIKKEEKEALRSLVAGLPDKYSTVIKKYYVQSKSYEEIAFEEGISTRAVESRLYRARSLLKDKWKEDT